MLGLRLVRFVGRRAALPETSSRRRVSRFDTPDMWMGTQWLSACHNLPVNVLAADWERGAKVQVNTLLSKFEIFRIQI